MTDQNRNNQRQQNEQLPVTVNEDVEFAEALADEEDLEAVERAEAADCRQE